MLARLGVDLRHRRPLRTPAAVRPDRRAGGGHAPGRPAPRHDAHRVRGRDRGRARGRGDRGPPDRPDDGRARRGSRPSRWRAWSSPTSPSGPSAPGGRPPPPTPSRPAPTSGRWWASWPGPRRPRRSGSSTEARCDPRTPRSWSAQPDVDGALVGGASLDAATFAGHRAGRGSACRPHEPAVVTTPLVALVGSGRPEEDARADDMRSWCCTCWRRWRSSS